MRAFLISAKAIYSNIAHFYAMIDKQVLIRFYHSWRAGVNMPTNYWTELLPGILLFGLGLSVTVAPLTSAILGSIQSNQAGIGSAVNNAVARIAGLLAVAVIGLLIGTSLDLNGFKIGITACAALLVVDGIISAAGIRNKLVNK